MAQLFTLRMKRASRFTVITQSMTRLSASLFSLLIFPIFLLLFTVEARSQKGLPSETPTAASVHTTYPQHEDFIPSMVNRLKVPAGFLIKAVATGLGKPRMMAINNGMLYVTRRDQGDVLLLTDKNADGVFEEMKTIIANFAGVHGIVINEGWLYLVSNRELKRGRLKTDGSVDSLELLIKDLPDGGQHPNRYLSFGPDGMLYITVGSTCNDCADANPENATVLQVTPDGKFRKIFARGLRNTIGIDWNPQTKEMWGADNGTDWRGDDKPHEEVNKISQGADYGWPLVYENQQVDETREDPIGTTKAAYAKTTQVPVLLMPAHAAPIDFRFLGRAGTIPPDYANDAIVTLHGSWNRNKPDGYNIQRIKFSNGQATGTEDFLTGFLSADGKNRFGRPAGLAVSPKGIYVSDDENGIIYLIFGK